MKKYNVYKFKKKKKYKLYSEIRQLWCLAKRPRQTIKLMNNSICTMEACKTKACLRLIMG